MKNKKGFTLIELLGVIIVMAVILMVSLPTITNMMKKDSTNTYDQFVKDIYAATETYIVDHEAVQSQLSAVGKTVNVTLKELIDTGYIKKAVIDPNTNVTITTTSYVKVVVQSDFTYQMEFIKK